MALNLANYKKQARDSVKAFWGNRAMARQKQLETGRVDQGERGSVTGGKNMDGFLALMLDIIAKNGLKHAELYQVRAALTVPGYFRPTKLWDLLVIHKGQLIAALEFKSQVGPSFGNNFNNRAEESIGTAHDFWTGYREGAFGKSPPPFLGWLVLVEQCEKSTRPITATSPHFPVREEFVGASYLRRYQLLCGKLVREQLYTAACVMSSPRTADESGEFRSLSELTSLKTFVSGFASHIAAAASR